MRIRCIEKVRRINSAYHVDNCTTCETRYCYANVLKISSLEHNLDDIVRQIIKLDERKSKQVSHFPLWQRPILLQRCTIDGPVEIEALLRLQARYHNCLKHKNRPA